jgi:hypothetical protein
VEPAQEAVDRHRLRTVEDREQRHAPHRLEVIDERPDRGLDALVGDQRDLHEPRVLEPRGEEVDAPAAPVQEADVDLAEVVLGELAGQPLEADERPPRGRADLRHQVVEDRSS